MKTYKGQITKVGPNQVFVFGSNLQGFHGAGSAGYASFGEAGNHWRKYDYANKPNGWKGKWNEKGVEEGLQNGTEGRSYALPTVTRAGAKRSRSPDEIKASIRRLYDVARLYKSLEFLIAQGSRDGLNGYTPEEMAEMWACEAIPDNVFFEEDFVNKFLKYELQKRRI